MNSLLKCAEARTLALGLAMILGLCVSGPAAAASENGGDDSITESLSCDETVSGSHLGWVARYEIEDRFVGNWTLVSEQHDPWLGHNSTQQMPFPEDLFIRELDRKNGIELVTAQSKRLLGGKVFRSINAGPVLESISGYSEPYVQYGDPIFNRNSAVQMERQIYRGEALVSMRFQAYGPKFPWSLMVPARYWDRFEFAFRTTLKLIPSKDNDEMVIEFTREYGKIYGNLKNYSRAVYRRAPKP